MQALNVGPHHLMFIPCISVPHGVFLANPTTLRAKAEERDMYLPDLWQEGGDNFNGFHKLSHRKWLKQTPESGFDWLMCSKFALQRTPKSCCSFSRRGVLLCHTMFCEAPSTLGL